MAHPTTPSSSMLGLREGDWLDYSSHAGGEKRRRDSVITLCDPSGLCAVCLLDGAQQASSYPNHQTSTRPSLHMPVCQIGLCAQRGSAVATLPPAWRPTCIHAALVYWPSSRRLSAVARNAFRHYTEASLATVRSTGHEAAIPPSPIRAARHAAAH